MMGVSDDVKFTEHNIPGGCQGQEGPSAEWVGLHMLATVDSTAEAARWCSADWDTSACPLTPLLAPDEFELPSPVAIA
jgi:hypothetical protein